MGNYISLSSEIGGRALTGAWALKGTNTVLLILFIIKLSLYRPLRQTLRTVIKRLQHWFTLQLILCLSVISDWIALILKSTLPGLITLTFTYLFFSIDFVQFICSLTALV